MAGVSWLKEHPAITFTTYLMRFVRYGHVFTEFFYYVKSNNVFRFSFVVIFKQLIVQNTFGRIKSYLV